MYITPPVNIIVKTGNLFVLLEFAFGDAKYANLEEVFFFEKSLFVIELLIFITLLFIFI